ncbi:hypothetical protein SAMN05421678_104211 [Actinopolymorpha cephalotaxi]|uniref:Excreted virulence factor EspC, type VII ESX diderm n=1 Tax=Actinopolymorpha cephalotaxi TaxID=504797 RepID=A0A1I2PQ81_9ACTN|nr:hypothetical protein [Actinopolymorpha cephalotaxi]NYH83537.1 hypothetical protein [Actinopolymorpha cephalotaxi]SFG17553.1 hypothetical protein SAMN05421678_104211 [Actinopolymorpha cephalotaxi]
MGTQVEPGALDSFAKYVDELADGWNDKSTSDAVRMSDSKEGDYNYPRLGDFGGAKTLTSTYEQKRADTAKSCGELYDALRGLAKATRKIADKYRSAEALNNANVGQIDKILGENIKSPAKDPTNPGTDPPKA